MTTIHSASEKGATVMLVFSPRTQLCQYGYPQVMLAWLSSGGNERARRRPGYGDRMYILCLLVFFSLGGPMSFEFYALAPILLPVAVNSPAYPVLFSSNVSLVLFFMDSVTTTQQLEGTWPTEEILCFTTNCPLCQPLYPTTQYDHGGLSW